jgi:hypothetical protein
MSLPFTKEEVEWWTEQAEKLKPFWYFFKNVPCDVLIKIVDTALGKPRGVACKQARSNGLYLWECADKYFLVFNGLEAPSKSFYRPKYADMLSDYGLLGVGVDEYKDGADCILRVLQIREIRLPFLDVSFSGIDEEYGIYYISIILNDKNTEYLAIRPHRGIIPFSIVSSRISMELAPKDIKRITERDDIRRYTEETIDRAVELFSELRLLTVVYILY